MQKGREKARHAGGWAKAQATAPFAGLCPDGLMDDKDEPVSPPEKSPIQCPSLEAGVPPRTPPPRTVF